MRRSDSRAALTDEVARFQADVQRLALDAIRAIIQQELDRRHAKQPRPPRAARRAAPPARPATRRGRAATARAQPTLPLPGLEAPNGATTAAASPDGAPTDATATTPGGEPAASAPPADATSGGRKRKAWTRDAIIEELASWMLSGTSIDATFVTRHGPPGLVAATRRVFGRFDAALNVAALHVSKLYPDGPPER